MRVLITGGTGSFGKKFTQIVFAKYPDVKKIIVSSRDEFKQFMMSNMPEFKPFEKKLRYFIGDVRDKERMMRAFRAPEGILPKGRKVPPQSKHLALIRSHPAWEV